MQEQFEWPTVNFSQEEESVLAKWVDDAEQILTRIAGLEGKALRNACGRGAGTVMKMKPMVGPTASRIAKGSQVTRAWATAAAWLRDLQVGLGSTVEELRRRGVRMEVRLRRHVWAFRHDTVHSRACTRWFRAMAAKDFTCRQTVAALRIGAGQVAARAVGYDRQQAKAQSLSWLHEGPSALSRQHKLSRVATGWIPSQTAVIPTDIGEAETEVVEEGERGEQL